MKKGIIHLIPLVILVLVLSVGTLAVIATKRTASLNRQSVLSSSDDKSGSSKNSSEGDSSGSSGGDDGKNDDNNHKDQSGSGSGSSSGSSTKTETTTSTGVRIKTETKNGETRTEVKFGEDEKIKTRIEEGRSRVDVYSGGVKVRLERRGDRFILKAENEEGESEELEGDEIIKIDERLEQDRIKIATASGHLVLSRNDTFALTDLPISVDLDTNQLTVSTPAGERILTVLPDQAVSNMLAANVIDRLGGQVAIDEATSSALPSIEGVIVLGQRSGIPIYEINGLRDQRLLGLIPVSTKITAVVSAENGELLETNRAFLDRIIDLLSF